MTKVKTTSSKQNRSLLEKIVPWLSPLTAVIILVGLYLASPEWNRSTLRLVTFGLMWVALASSWNLIGGYTGYIDFGHTVFIGVGGYSVGILVARLGLLQGAESILEQQTINFTTYQALPITFIIGALFAGLMGYPTLRLKGPYFAIAMLGTFVAVREVVRADFGDIGHVLSNGFVIALFTSLIFVGLSKRRLQIKAVYFVIAILAAFFVIQSDFSNFGVTLTNGGRGISFLAPFAKPEDIFVLMLFFTGLIFFISLWIYRSQFGKMLQAIREDEVGADMRGINTTGIKIGIFMLAGGFTAMIGGLKGWWDGYIDPTTIFPDDYTIQLIMMVMLGGIGRPWGAVLGAVVFYYGRITIWANAGQQQLMITGLLLIFIVLFMPNGILGFLDPEDRGLLWFIRNRLLRQNDETNTDEDFAFRDVSEARTLEPMTQSTVTDSSNQKVVLQGKGVTKDFGGLRAVDHVDFEIRQGEIVGLLGPNGSGKTTLFNCISGVLPTSEGEVYLNGELITGHAPWRINRTGLSRTFQRLRVYGKLTVFRNMLLARKWKGVPPWMWLWLAPQDVRDKADELMGFLRLDHVRDNLADNLSGGQQRLLEIGMTLMSDPLVVLLDEATSGVNPALVEEIKDDIRRLNQELGVTFFLVEHNMSFAMELCSRIYVLDYGKKIAEGTPADIQGNDEVIEAYFGRDE